MIRFFRTRTPFFGLLLIVALLVTLPGIRHPLPMLALVIFTLLAWRTIAKWQSQQAPAPVVELEDRVARAAADWDARHGAPDELDDNGSDDEPWRASLRPNDGWRGANDTDEP